MLKVIDEINYLITYLLTYLLTKIKKKNSELKKNFPSLSSIWMCTRVWPRHLPRSACTFSCLCLFYFFLFRQWRACIAPICWSKSTTEETIPSIWSRKRCSFWKWEKTCKRRNRRVSQKNPCSRHKHKPDKS